METNADLLPMQPGERALALKDHSRHRLQVGELLYLAVCTRMDIMFAVAALARSVHAPTERHSKMLLRLLRYVSATPDHSIKYSVAPVVPGLLTYSDADWAGCLESRRSTSGSVHFHNRSPVSWKSTRKTIVALSSAEAEYVALSSTVKELT